MIQVSESARTKLKEVLDSNPGKFVRVMFEGYGWGGPRLGLALDEPNKDENAVKVEGIDLLISEDIKTFAERSRIDYIQGPYREGFTVGLVGGGC